MMTMMMLLQSMRMLATTASRERVTRSPRAAAMGVATLSGLTLYLLDTAITATITIPNMNDAAEAVMTLLAARTRALPMSALSVSPVQAINIAIKDAKPPTTMPWT